MKKFLLLILLLILQNDLLNAQILKLTLQESIEYGLETSDELKIAESKIISNRAKVKEINSQFFPQLRLTAGYTRLSAVDPFLIIIPFTVDPVQLSEVFVNNYNFVLSLRQPLFTGLRLSSLKSSAQLFTKSYEYEFDNEKNNVAFNIQTAFWNYYKTKLIKDVADENVSQTEQHIIDTKNFLINGLATNSDLLKLEVQNSNAKLLQLDAANNIELARVSFNKILGLPLDSKTDLYLEKIETESNEFILSNLINEAYQNRYELKSIDYKIKSAIENIKAVKSAFYPSVYLGANYYYSNPNLRYQPPVDDFKGSWDANVTLSWDVWNWGFTSALVTQSEQSLVQSKTNLDQLKDAIELEVNQNFLNLNYQKERIEVSKKTIEQAEENYRVTMEKYNVQLATSTDIVDAETSLFQTKTNYTNAIVDYKIALIKLYKSVGRKLY